MRLTVRATVLLLMIVVLLQACGTPQAPAAGNAAQGPSPEAASSVAASQATRAVIATESAAGAAASTVPSAVASAAASAGSNVTIKVVTLPFISFAPFYIADAEGFFAEQGIDIELVNMTQQAEIMPALASGQVDVASGLVSAGILNTIAKGANIKIVADKGYIDPQGCDNIALIASKQLLEQGVASNPELLKGKTMILIRTTWLDYAVEKQLKEVGLAVEDMEVTDIPSPSQPEALNSGQIQLTMNNEPWVTRFTEDGHAPILTPIHELLPDAQSAVTVFGPKLLGDNAEVGNRFMLAYLKAVRQYNEGKTDRNVQILADSVKLDPELMKKMCWPQLRPNGEINIASVQDFQQWTIDHKLMDGAVDEMEFWDGQFVENAVRQLGKVER